MIEIQVDLDNETILFLALKAHKEDITLNQYINNILKNYIDNIYEEKNEND
jgi:predicted HicB family RNase H-like nuclease